MFLFIFCCQVLWRFRFQALRVFTCCTCCVFPQGWWFGPEVGGEEVWAHNPGSPTSTWPPTRGWRVLHSGVMDPQLTVTRAETPTQRPPWSATGSAGDGANASHRCVLPPHVALSVHEQNTCQTNSHRHALARAFAHTPAV